MLSIPQDWNHATAMRQVQCTMQPANGRHENQNTELKNVFSCFKNVRCTTTAVQQVTCKFPGEKGPGSYIKRCISVEVKVNVFPCVGGIIEGF